MSAGRIICIRDSRGEDPLPCGFSLSQPSGPLGLPLTPPPTSALGEGAGRNSGGLTVGPQSRRWVSVTWAGGGCSLAHTYTALEKTQWKWSSTRAPQGKVTVLLSGSGRESRELSAHQRVPLTPPADQCPRRVQEPPPLHPPSWYPPRTQHGSPSPRPHHSRAAAPEGQIGSVRDRASFRVCLISITCFPATRGSRPMSGRESLKAQGSLQVPYLSFRPLTNTFVPLPGYSKLTWGMAHDWVLRRDNWLGRGGEEPQGFCCSLVSPCFWGKWFGAHCLPSNTSSSM